jgi:FkbM family methyltransferase
MASLIRDAVRAVRTRARPRAILEALVLDQVLGRPIVYEDSRRLRYVLYPHENALAYLNNEGNYEVGETLLCERLVGDGMTVFDVGANIGIYSLLLARLVGHEGTVHAFEPEPRNFDRLMTNLTLNGAANVVANRLAVYSESGEVTLNLFDPSLGSWHSLGTPKLADPDHPRRTVEPRESIAVEAVSLDDYARSREIVHVDFLKIDVEGAEPAVLEGAADLFERQAVGLVQFEISIPQSQALGHDGSGIFEFLRRRRFVCRRILPDGSLGATAVGANDPYGNYLAVPEEAADST